MKFLTVSHAKKVISNYTGLHHFQKFTQKEIDDVLYISCRMEDNKNRCFQFSDFLAEDGLNDKLLTKLLRKTLLQDEQLDKIYAAALFENENKRHEEEILSIYALINECEAE